MQRLSRICRLPLGAVLGAALLLNVAAAPAAPWSRFIKKSNPAGESLDDYLKTVRAVNVGQPLSVGSLWLDASPLAVLAADYKGRNPGDTILVHLSDNFNAVSSGENKQSRAFTSNSAITGLIGTIGARNRLQNLFNANSGNTLDGTGSSTLSSTLSVDLAAEVIETLPNGMMVVQGARDILVGNDRQTVIVRGLVRPGDVAPDNSVRSALIGNLQVEIKGKGAVADVTRQPNIVIRTLLHLFSF
jgi:flagellar L-ring protein FlgH